VTERELSVVIPTYRRSAKLKTLMEGIARTPADHEAFEVVVVVDGRDEAPLATAEALPDSIRFIGLTKEHAGPAAARNHALEQATGRWVLFYDDDARLEPDTIPGHLERIRRDPDADEAWLGRVDWPAELIDSPWRALLADTSMLFFWDRMQSGRSYGFRHFWTTNLSVRRDLVRAAGGFHEAFPSAIHEDIELGWRLQQQFGLQVRVDTSIRCEHDHALEPRDYFLREHKSGASARAARSINRRFHDAVWDWLDDPAGMLALLERLFAASCREVLDLLERWAVPSQSRPAADERRAAYLAHLPLKRMFFLQGYLERPFEGLWGRLHDS
jgi:glycosyltransferase involved in cell wall biosynthesis